MKKYISFLPLLLFSFSLIGQQQHEEHKKHMITGSIGHAHVGNGVQNGVKRALVLPAWGLNYDFRLSEKWSIGLHNDMIIEEFEFEQEEANIDIINERSRPISSAVTVSYRLTEFIATSVGFGREFAPEQSFNLIRIGIEPFYELPNNFELVGTFSADFRFEAYNAFNIAFGIAKKF